MPKKKNDVDLAPCSIRIPFDMKLEIERLASKSNRSFNSQMNMLLSKAVKMPVESNTKKTVDNG
jgi:hypothetical protein